MSKIRNRRLILSALFILIVICTIYNVYDNRRFVITRQDITLSRLPKEFDGYKILQISDLHSRYFGKKQENLTSAINQLDYDCIIFSGDMNKDIESTLSDSQTVIDLINGINKKDMMLWVDGNSGPFAMEAIGGSYTGDLTPIGEALAERGVQMLLFPIETSRSGKSIWFVPDMSKMNTVMNYSDVPEELFESPEQYEKIISHGNILQKWYDELKNNDEVKIRIDHFPMQANLSEEGWNSVGYLDYDLSIAGHYHGGQIRIPFYGAVYIPSPTSGIHNGYFPKQKEVKGLNQILDMQQYISAGLGASDSISFLDFRVFDTPEINLLTLHSER